MCAHILDMLHICIYVYVYVCICLYIYTYIFLYIYTYTYIFTHIRTFLYAHRHTYTYMYIVICMYILVHAPIIKRTTKSSVGRASGYLELMLRCNRELPEALMMMIPEAYKAWRAAELGISPASVGPIPRIVTHALWSHTPKTEDSYSIICLKCTSKYQYII